MMKGDFYTFLLFTGAHGKLRKVRLPLYAMQLILAFALVGVMTVGALANSYARMLLKVSNYNEMRTDREALKSQNRSLATVVTQANAKLDSLESLAGEVALAYGFADMHRPRVSPDILALATLTNSTPDSVFPDSLYAFSLLQTAALNARRNAIPEALLADYRFDRSPVPSIWPVRGQITAGFGQRMDPFSGEGAFHAGIDIAAPAGTQVEAAADGILFHAGPDGSYGNEILIDHGYGIMTKYGHLSATFGVVGQEVKRGQVIGTVGMTGRTTGPHLHYEVLIHATRVNPAKYLRG
jgi:murein DD-endopeptidase MepM/ murein hydrolase activator NlpD